MTDTVYTTDEHVALREQVARFIAKEVEPHGAAWEEQGCVPREVLRKMGELGFFGITYPAEFGGSEADALTSLVLAEALSRSTFGGFIVTALVHSDMVSPHLVNTGSREELEKYLARVIRGDLITAVAVTEPDAGSDAAAIRTQAAPDAKITDILRVVGEIQEHSRPVIEDCYRDFLLRNPDPDAADQIREVLIHGNYLSRKDNMDALLAGHGIG